MKKEVDIDNQGSKNTDNSSITVALTNLSPINKQQLPTQKEEVDERSEEEGLIDG